MMSLLLLDAHSIRSMGMVSIFLVTKFVAFDAVIVREKGRKVSVKIKEYVSPPPFEKIMN